jgi:hypothetical protein
MNQLDQFFPGSSTPLNFEEIREAKVKEIEDWDYKPYTFLVGGVETEFFSIGQLGKALGGRSPNTLRAWEREGILPKSPYVKPSNDPRGRRRMYTRAQVEGLMKIAKEESVFWPHKGQKLMSTKFSAKAKELFTSLRRQ